MKPQTKKKKSKLAIISKRVLGWCKRTYKLIEETLELNNVYKLFR